VMTLRVQSGSTSPAEMEKLRLFRMDQAKAFSRCPMSRTSVLRIGNGEVKMEDLILTGCVTILFGEAASPTSLRTVAS